jgi:MFS family permease
MIVVMTGVLITAVDTTIVVLALPAIERELHVALSSVIWVVIGYLLVITLLATQVVATATATVRSRCTPPTAAPPRGK